MSKKRDQRTEKNSKAKDEKKKPVRLQEEGLKK
jgi:hypothetical protein